MLYSILYTIVYILLFLKFIAITTKGYCRSNACLIGKTAIITGGNSGMGYECALNLASRGCRVIIADVVDAQKSVKTIIEKTGNTNIAYKHIDLASFASVREFAKSLRSEEERLDILVNNAGCGGFTTKSSDGIYKVLQINHLGHFLLTNLLTPLLIETKNSRIVFVCSILAFTHNLKKRVKGETMNRLANCPISALDWFFEYGNSKFAMLAASDIFAARLKKHGVLVSACHPGIVKTGIFDAVQRNGAKSDLMTLLTAAILFVVVQLFGKTPVEGIQSTLHCALSSRVQAGDYVVDCRNFPKPWALDEQFRNEIWHESVLLASLTKEEDISVD